MPIVSVPAASNLWIQREFASFIVLRWQKLRCRVHRAG